jgi:serine phosphatase RsbU (regulator of sigma subunit)/ligand-binding sensor domain-containing protein
MKHFIPVIRFIITMILIINPLQVSSQEGNPFFTNIKLPAGIDNQNWAIAQNEDGVMFFANRKGILNFDGLEWNYLESVQRPYSLIYEPSTNRIYVGCEDNFGFITKNNYGKYIYQNISSEFSELGSISLITFNQTHIYFYSDQTITQVELEDINNKKVWRANPGNPFMGMVLFDTLLFINIKDIGLHKIAGDSILLVPDGDLIDKDEIIFSIPFNQKEVLFATDNSFIYRFDGEHMEDYIIEDEEYIQESVLSGGIELNDKEIALATLTGGCVIVNKDSGKTKFTLNYQTGLPDDEIYTIGKDNSNGLWLSHEYGTSRIDFSIPVRNYNSYPGLEGNLLSLVDFNNTIYVSTSEGVYFLTEVKDYAEIEVLVKARSGKTDITKEKIPQRVKRKTREKTSEPTEQEAASEETETEKPRKGFLSRIFKKEAKPKETPEARIETVQAVSPEKSLVEADTISLSETPPKTTYVKKKTYALQSIKHKFNKIKGLDDKCRQLVKFKDQILVGTNTGLYRIKNNEIKFIAAYTYINYILPSKKQEGLFYIGTPEGAFTVAYRENTWNVNREFFTESVPVYSIFEGNECVWLGSDTKAYRIKLNEDCEPIKSDSYYFLEEFSEKVMIRGLECKPYFLLSTSIYDYETERDELIRIDTIQGSKQQFYHYIFSGDGQTWISKNQVWQTLDTISETGKVLPKYLKLFDRIQNIYSDTNKNIWIVDEDNKLNKILYSEISPVHEEFNIFIKSITNEEGMSFSLSELDFNAENNSLEFKIIAPYYIKSSQTQYQYFLEGLSQTWVKWMENPVISFPYLPPNDYILHVRAKNILSTISPETSVRFSIAPPFTKTVWFYILIGIGIILAVYVLIFIRERKLQHDKKILEIKVRERTKRIEEQKEEIMAQRDEIEEQRDEIVMQKQEITDSIQYARRIQNAILPPKDFIGKVVPDHFILFKPRDIVSGDFYWITQKDNKIILAGIDCTGHGVPGAFMSMLGYSQLNEIANNYKITKANLILNRLRNNIKIALRQTGREGEAKDGMDMALCILDLNTHNMQFSGAYNPLYLIRDKKLIEIKGDKMPIGIYINEKKSFTNHEQTLKKGDVIYIFSDGYIDQFGGEKGGKFKSKPFKKLLLDIHSKHLNEQGKILNTTLENWKGTYEQVDDILVMGFRI